MLANKIKERMEAIKKSDLEKLDKENEAIRLAQEKDLKLLNKLLDSIKKDLTDIADGKTNLKTTTNGNIVLSDSRSIFGNSFYNRKFLVSNSSEDLLNVLDNKMFSNTLREFKEWLDQEGVEKIIVSLAHDGGGMTSWNNYVAKLKS